MKKYTSLRVLCGALLLAMLASCAAPVPELPPNLPEQYDEHMYPPAPTVGDSYTTTVTKELLPIPPYEESTIFPSSTHMVNLPEVILTANQTYERAMYCLEKSTNTERIFCYDPDCTHENCVSHHFSDPKQLIYSHYNGCLYGCLDINVDSNLSLLYRIDCSSLEVECVWQGNGCTIRAPKAIYQNYLYFSTQGASLENEIFRMNLDDHSVEQLSPPKDLPFYDFMISDDVFLVRFYRDDEYYQTDEDFSQFTPTGIYDIAYLNAEQYIQKITRTPTNEERSATNEFTCGYALGDLDAETVTEFFHSELLLYTLGFDGEYIYYRCVDPRPNRYVANHTLYRVNIYNGESEPLCRYDDGVMLEVACYDGVIYYYKEDAAKEVYAYTKAFLYGRLVRAETTLLAKDFPIYYPTAVIERVTAPK